MRSVLVGAVGSTQVALEALAAAQAPPELVLTLPPELAHRHSDYVDLAPVCRRWQVPIAHIRNVNDPEALQLLGSRNPDHLFVIGWSQICGEALLAIPGRGAIGYHPAPLPVNRGRAVIPPRVEGAVIAGPSAHRERWPADDGPPLARSAREVRGRATEPVWCRS